MSGIILLIEKAVAALPFVLTVPEGPDCDLKAFGESAVDFSGWMAARLGI